MRVTLTQQLCGPDGNASQGTVLDIPEKKMQTYWDTKNEKESTMPLAEYMIEHKLARAFDPQLDSKAKVGLTRADR